MVYIPAISRFAFPRRQSWQAWTTAARALRKKCAKSKDAADVWRAAESEHPVIALWAAAFAKHRGTRGQWVLAELDQRRAWLDELQRKPAEFAN